MSSDWNLNFLIMFKVIPSLLKGEGRTLAYSKISSLSKASNMTETIRLQRELYRFHNERSSVTAIHAFIKISPEKNISFCGMQPTSCERGIPCSMGCIYTCRHILTWRRLMHHKESADSSGATRWGSKFPSRKGNERIFFLLYFSLNHLQDP